MMEQIYYGGREPSGDDVFFDRLEAGSFVNYTEKGDGKPLWEDIQRENTQRRKKNMIRIGAFVGMWIALSVICGKLFFSSENAVLVSQNNGSNEEVFLKPYSYFEAKDPQRQLTLKQLRTGKFSPDIKEIQWIHSNDSGTYLTKNNSQYVISKIEDASYSKILYDSKFFCYDGIRYEIDDLVASPDLQFALLATNRSMVWRHSSTNLFWVLDVSTRRITPLLKDGEKIFFAKWAPDSNHLAFVKNNNIWVKDIAADSTVQVTFDGDANIFNGKPDWVYEEEVFEDEFALWWSPDSNYLAFLKFNDTQVPNFPLNFYVPDENPDSSYPVPTKIKYPKAGAHNPKTSVNVYNVQNQNYTQLVNNYKDDQFMDYLVTEVLWVGTGKLYLRTTNRVSNVLKILIVDAIELNYLISRHETINNGWFELTHDTVYVPKDETKGRYNDGYIDTTTVNGYNHLAYYSPINVSTPLVLTKGEYEVVDGVTAFDADANKVYFISTKHSSIDRHLYSVDLLNRKEPVPLTDDTTSGYYSASFSTDSKNVLLSYLGPNVPYQKIISWTSKTLDAKTQQDVFANGKNITTNDKLIQTLKSYDIPTLQYKEINLGKDDQDNDIIANVREIRPFDFDVSKKYPLFVYVYQGPNSQLITSKFGVSLMQVLSSSLNAVVVTVDGRGTGFKGKHYRSVVYQNLSHYETIDQIKAAKIYSTKSYIDPERTLIYGHSYGGYMTLKTLENDDEKVFKYGISGAPVTDWRLYDSIYTERYMTKPQDNLENYLRGAVGGSGNLTNFQNTKRFLILHGTGDDNVHIQNLYRLLDKFDRGYVENNYDLMVFPDSNHGVSYHNAGYIMYNKIIWWSKMAFNGEFDSFGDYDYHNGNLPDRSGAYASGVGSRVATWGTRQQYQDEDDSEYLRF